MYKHIFFLHTCTNSLKCLVICIKCPYPQFSVIFNCHGLRHWPRVDVVITIFCDFCQISAKNWRFSQCYELIFSKTSSSLSKKRQYFRQFFFGESILKIITSVLLFFARKKLAHSKAVASSITKPLSCLVCIEGGETFRVVLAFFWCPGDRWPLPRPEIGNRS
jgi:hypothetical protein